MIEAYVTGVSIWGPGLEGWEASQLILRGEHPYEPRESPPPAPSILPPNERRRTGQVTRLALNVAQEAAAMSGLPPASIRSVFGSSNGDAVIVHEILEAVSSNDRPVSPTQFHNSVHNAAAGYWTIAIGSAQPATCLGCHDGTFAASFLKAIAEVEVEQAPVLLCVYDVPVPAPLSAKRLTEFSFGVAFVLTTAASTRSLAKIGVQFQPSPSVTEAEDPVLSDLRPLSRANPAARALRLLECIATGKADICSSPYLDGRIDIHVTPCSPDTRS